MIRILLMERRPDSRDLLDCDATGSLALYDCQKPEYADFRIKSTEPDVVILDQDYVPRANLFGLLSKLRRLPQGPALIVRAKEADADFILECCHAGVDQIVCNSSALSEYHAKIVKALAQAALRQGVTPLVSSLVGESQPMMELKRKIRQYALCDASVLICGESGTGKEVVARTLHANSRRAQGRFEAVNCSAIPPSLFESEMFGNEEGAFTDAKLRQGVFERVSDGILFLDEISELNLESQAKLLRVLENGEYRKLGGQSLQKTACRVLYATNSQLKEEVRKKRFRQDLFFRINVLTLVLPPLRERREDLAPLASRFARRNSCRLDFQCLPILEKHDWPGNVRELRIVIERASVHCREGLITPWDIEL